MKNNEQKAQESTQRLERAIKVLILLCALNLVSRNILLYKINVLISKYNKELPKELIDRDKYIVGAYSSAMTMVKQVYEPLVYNFVPSENIQKPIDYVKDLTILEKGSPTEKYYPTLINNALKNLNRRELVYSDNGKKPISLWQKTELDIRHEEQMKMVQRAIDSGHDLWWLSSHANSSERCEPWQGKLVSLSLPPIDNSFWTGKVVDGHKVYSFNAIENVVDKYGYKNNIINGFNCRHKLIKYVKGKDEPIHYDKNDVDQVRKLEKIQREMERAIRKKKTELATTELVDKDKAKKLKRQIRGLTAQYRDFCYKHGLVREDYRIF